MKKGGNPREMRSPINIGGETPGTLKNEGIFYES